MSQVVDFGETANVTVMVLVDNCADQIARSTDTVKRFTKKPLLAEHGFSALIHLQDAGIRILWDAGATRISLLENARQLEIDLTSVSVVALSHSHADHTTAMADAIRVIGRRVPLVAHPAVFRERWVIDREGTRHGPVHPVARGEWEAAGAEMVLSSEPYQLGPGCWTTGYVPRRSFEQEGIPKNLYYREGDSLIRDEIEDDQAIAIHVRGKGLVVVSGCAHAGIVNTIRRAQEISGVDRVWGVLGGFHLGRSSQEQVEQTIDAIKALHPAIISPQHCTGFGPTCRFAAEMPQAFTLGLVGTTYLF